jgi:acetyl-CoA acetyltransferase
MPARSMRRLHSTRYPMLHGRPVAILGGVRIPFCKQNTAYADVGNLGMSVRTLGALVEKFGLHGQQLGEVALGAVIKHSATGTSAVKPRCPPACRR